jgi:hypothetical protein
MGAFEELHRDRITGKSGDVRPDDLQGPLQRALQADGARCFLWSQGVPLKDFAPWVQATTERVAANARKLARDAGRPVISFDHVKVRKRTKHRDEPRPLRWRDGGGVPPRRTAGGVVRTPPQDRGARAGAIGARRAALSRRAGVIPQTGKWAPGARWPRIHGPHGVPLHWLLPGESDCETLVLTIAIGGDADAESPLAALETEPIEPDGKGVVRTVGPHGASPGG